MNFMSVVCHRLYWVSCYLFLSTSRPPTMLSSSLSLSAPLALFSLSSSYFLPELIFHFYSLTFLTLFSHSCAFLVLFLRFSFFRV